MKIAVASGKGGTGKTTVAVSLARSLANAPGSWPRPHEGLLFLDCDVEAPDARLLLHPELEETVPATLPHPRISPEFCTLCGDCAEACRFNALAVLGDQVLCFPELCHGCGSCGLLCPTRAISEVSREIGALEAGWAGVIRFAQGTLNVGEAQAVPVIKQLKEWAAPTTHTMTILDSPPGTSCPMVEAVSEADFVILVTEPTPSGLHDLELADKVLWEMGIPAGVVVNRDGSGYPEMEESPVMSRLPVLVRIPFDRTVAQGLAGGRTLVDLRPELEVDFRTMVEDIAEAVSGSRTSVGTGPGPGNHQRVRHGLRKIRAGRAT